MQEPEIKLVITSLAPEPVHHRGKTGGGVRMAEILRRLGKRDGIDIFCIATPHNRNFFEKNGIEAGFRIVKSNLKFKSMPGLFLKSLLIMAKSFFVLKTDFLESKDKKVILYSSSDLFWEVIPNYFFRKRKKNIEWVQAIYHIYPDWRTRPGNKAINFFGYWLQRFSFLLIRHRADKIILINNIVKSDLKKMGFSENRMHVCSNGIDTEYFGNIKGSGSAYEGVYLGRLSPSKGFMDLVEIWKNVCREFPRAKLAVIGGGEKEKERLKNKIAGNKLEENIDLLGYLEDEKAHPVLKSAKILLFPSHEEGWGIAIAEAMACGLPVVGWDLPVFREIFDDYIIVANENDTNQFSEKIVELLKNESLRRKIGGDCRDFVKKYSWDEVAEREFEIIAS